MPLAVPSDHMILSRRDLLLKRNRAVEYLECRSYGKNRRFDLSSLCTNVCSLWSDEYKGSFYVFSAKQLRQHCIPGRRK